MQLNIILPWENVDILVNCETAMKVCRFKVSTLSLKKETPEWGIN